jgi:hypothetical protein
MNIFAFYIYARLPLMKTALNPYFLSEIASAVRRFGRMYRAFLYRRISDTPTTMPRKLNPNRIDIASHRRGTSRRDATCIYLTR